MTLNAHSYCNSIVQALYYSEHFRNNVVKYPPHSPLDTPNGHALPPINVPIRNLNGAAASTAKPKGISASEALKRRAQVNSATPPANGQVTGTKPEDKPDSPEYKKKHAMMKGPILELTYESASSYGMEESTFTALKDIFMALIMNQARTGVVSPQRFLEIFKRDNEAFRTTAHQDAHEFYGIVLNAVISNVEDDAKRIRELEPRKMDNGLTQSALSAVTNAASAMGLASGARSPGTGWVHDIFEGVLTSETRCLTCETASQRDETFLDLSIDLEEHSSVTSCLRKFSAEEMLCERNKFHCDNCGGLQEAEKRMKIKKLPKILALHLKRFKYTEDMSRLQKLFHRVVYPYHLRMFNTTDDAEDPDRLYELYAVVVHIGGNAYHGHYVSIIKTQDRGWLLFDDEMVEPVDKNYVRNFFGDKPGQACAYVLFYQETTLEAVQREQEAEGLAEVALVQEEAGIALGNGKPNGTHPSSTSKAVVDQFPNHSLHTDMDPLVSLDHAMTAPLATSPNEFPSQPLTHFSSANPPLQGPLQGNPMSKTTTPLQSSKAGQKPRDKKSDKLDKEREKKEAKEAKKEAKIAEKEKIKADEKRRRDTAAALIKRRETERQEYEAALALSKATAAEDEERRKREPATNGEADAPYSATTTTNGSSGEKQHVVEPKKSGILGGLNRNAKGSKSMSRRSFGFLAKKDKEQPPMPNLDTRNGSREKLNNGAVEARQNVVNGSGEKSESRGSDGTSPESQPGMTQQMPDTPTTMGKVADKAGKERFSFGLGRKKSTVLLG